MISRFHATVAVSDDQPKEPSVVGPKRTTPKNAVRAAIVMAVKDGIDERVKVEVFEDGVAFVSGFGDSLELAGVELNTVIDRNRRRF